MEFSAELAMQRTLRQVRTDLVTGLSYAMAGKSIAALSQNDLTNSSTKVKPERLSWRALMYLFIKLTIKN